MTIQIIATHSLLDIYRQSTFLPTIAALLGLLAVLLFLAYKIRATFYERQTDDPADSEEMLLMFEEMRREGDLTDPEFRSIKSRILPSRTEDKPAESDD